MYRALVFLLPAMLGAAGLTIDHVTVAGKDLKAMQARLATIGIESQYGGPHSNHATEMALTSFPDGSYLELIAIQPNADAKAVAANAWAKQMEGNAGPCAWAVREKDINAEVKRLQAGGVTVGSPERGGRERPDGTGLAWETAQVGSEARGTFFPFLIRDLTQRKKRAFPTGKPTNRDFDGVATVVIAVRDLEDAVKRYRKAYDLPAPLKQVDADFGAHLALMGGTSVVLASPLTRGSWLAARIDRFGEGPCAFILSLKKKTNRYKAAAKARWFANDISWFDSEALGWHLGFE